MKDYYNTNLEIQHNNGGRISESEYKRPKQSRPMQNNYAFVADRQVMNDKQQKAIGRNTIFNRVAAAVLLILTTMFGTVLQAQTPDTAICAGTTLTLTAKVDDDHLGTAPYDYAWSATPNDAGCTPGMSGTLTTTDSYIKTNSITIIPFSKSGDEYTDYTYTCVVKDAHECTKELSVTVRVYPMPNVSVTSGAENVICLGQPITDVSLTYESHATLSTSPSLPSGLTLTNHNNGLDTINGKPTATQSETTYHVVGSNSYVLNTRTYYCKDTADIKITVKDTIIPVISSENNICISSSQANNVLTITQTTTATGYTQTWNVGTDGEVLTGQGTGTITAKWTSHGEKTITVTLTKDGSCTSSTTKTIYVHPKPAASIDLVTGTICPNAGTVDITGRVTTPTTADYTYTWGGGLAVATSPQTISATTHTVAATVPSTPCNKTYKVGMDVVDNYGCKVICDSITVAVQDNAGPTIKGTLPVINYESCGTKPDAYASVSALIFALQDAGAGTGITDICTSADDLTLTYSDGTVTGDCNKTFTRTYTVKDACNNGTTITQTINLKHLTPPTAVDATPVATSNLVTCISATATVPTLPTVKDQCGTTLISPTLVKDTTWEAGKTGCKGTVKYNYTYTDCAGLTYEWTYTYNINDNVAPVITGTLPAINVDGCTAGDKPDAYVSIDALVAAMTGEGKGVSDNCTPYANLELSHSDGDLSSGCTKTFTRTYTVTDACGNGSTIMQTINLNMDNGITITGGTNSCQVECASAIVLPHEITPSVMPTVTDACGTTLGTGQPAVGGTYTACEGSKTYTYTYEDCAGHTASWTYTYTIDRTTVPHEDGGPVETSSNVTCLTATGTAPTLPVMKDVCGNTLSPSAPVKDTVWEEGKTGCKGVVRWKYTYTDCSNLSTVWTYTYNINDNVLPTIGDVDVPAAVASSNCKYAIPNLQSATLAVSSDNCNSVSWVGQSPAAGALYTQTSVAQNITVTVTVQDACGNQQSKDVTVEIPANTFTVKTIDSTFICGGGTALTSRTLTTTATNNNGEVIWPPKIYLQRLASLSPPQMPTVA